MKTTLTHLALFLAVALPTAATADSLGLSLPTLVSPTNLFGALITTFILLTIVSDYSRKPRLALRHPVAAPTVQKATHPLAA